MSHHTIITHYLNITFSNYNYAREEIAPLDEAGLDLGYKFWPREIYLKSIFILSEKAIRLMINSEQISFSIKSFLF